MADDAFYENYDYYEKLSLDNLLTPVGDENSTDNTEAIYHPPDVIAKVVIALIICVLGLIGNLVAMFVILVLKEYQKSVTHWYVLQLAIADSIFLLTLPFKVSEDLNGQWIYPEWMCKGKETILFLNYYASILFLVIMSFDRYVAVCHTFSGRLQKMRKKFSAFVIAIVIWSVSLLGCIPVMLYSFKVGSDPQCKCSYEFPRQDSRTSLCIEEGFNTPETLVNCLSLYNVEVHNNEIYCVRHVITTSFDDSNEMSGTDPTVSNSTDNPRGFAQGALDPSDESQDFVTGACHYWDRTDGWYAFLSFNFAGMFLVPLIVMVVCYGLIIRRLSATRMRTTSVSSTVSFTQTNGSNPPKNRRKSSSRSDKDRRRVTIMCATLVSCFVICWLPFHAVHLAKIQGIQNTESRVCEGLLAAGSLLAYLNSALNPYLYSFLGTNFTRRWRLLKKSHGIRQFISMAAWRGDSSGSNRQYQSRNGRNRNLSQQSRHQYSTNNYQSPLPTMTTKVSASKISENNAPQHTQFGNQSEAGDRRLPPYSEAQKYPTEGEMEVAVTPELC